MLSPVATVRFNSTIKLTVLEAQHSILLRSPQYVALNISIS